MSNQNLSLTQLRTVVFDWDNTLALSRGALIYSINQILPAFGLKDWDSVKDLRDCTLSFRDNFPIIFGDKAEEAYALYRQVYKKNVRVMIKAPDKAVDVLIFLQKKGVKNVIVSNKDRELLEYEMPFLYERSLFDNIVCGHEAEKDKPHAEQLLHGVKGIVNSVTRETVWMIGDSPMDSACALAAGAKAIRIGKPIWGNEDEDKKDNVLFFEDFADFYKAITE